MADPRIFKLTDTLNASGLDWLASEVLAGISAGCLPREDDAVIEAAQRSALRTDQHRYDSPSPDVVEARPFSPEEQVDWAATYVATRLKDAIEMMAAALQRIDEIVTFDADAGTSGAARTGSAIVLGDGEAASEVAGGALRIAEAALPALQKALDEWRGGARGSPE